MRQASDNADVRVAALAADEWAVLTTAQLLDCGLSRSGVARRVRNGRLHPKHLGVFAVGHPAITLEGRFLAAVKACGPGAVLSHQSAGALWGLLPWSEREIDVLVEGTAPRAHDGIRAHRTIRLDAEDRARPRASR